MMQIYLLSVLLNLIVGLILVSKKKQNPVDADIKESDETAVEVADSKNVLNNQLFASNTFNIVVGAASIVIGILKLFVVSKSRVVIIGDLFPAVTGITGGFALLVAYFVEKSSTADNLNDIFKRIFITNSSLIGIACIVVAVIHFILPGVLFL